ncbi:MarR family winged helix-turn-helix transcriptional regulator [Streptomyces flavofungini]|uniref:MarR family winged helix-turn-helix transcriptional regulator n=1 Tax=Streptomyces flavofungini TaxID=68200 RepID=UPI0034DE42AE
MSDANDSSGGPGPVGTPDPTGTPGSTSPDGPTGPDDLARRTRQDLLSRAALTVFRLNGQFLARSEELARPAGLTAAWWQVLGAVLREPLPVAGIGRAMGITRQSVQRVADLLVRDGLAEYVPNPAHRRAKLLRPTDAGRAAVARIEPGHAELAGRLSAVLGEREFVETVRVLERLSEVLDALSDPDAEPVTEP